MLLAHQAVRHRVVKRLAAVQRATTRHALAESRQEPNQPHQPKLEIRQRHPDLARAQLMQHGNRQPEDRVVRLALGQQFVERFGDVLQRNYARVVQLARERRLQNVARIKAAELLALAIVVIRSNQRQRLQRSAEAPAATSSPRARQPLILPSARVKSVTSRSASRSG